MKEFHLKAEKGVNRIYPISPYIIEKLEQKGVLYLINGMKSGALKETSSVHSLVAHRFLYTE